MGRRKDKEQHDHAVGFSGDSRNMKSGGKLGCRVINDWCPEYGTQLDRYRLVPVTHGLSYYDRYDPDSVGTYDWAGLG